MEEKEHMKQYKLKIGEYQNGKEIIVDSRDFVGMNFRHFLHNMLERDITIQTRERIKRALETPLTQDEKIARMQERMKLENPDTLWKV